MKTKIITITLLVAYILVILLLPIVAITLFNWVVFKLTGSIMMNISFSIMSILHLLLALIIYEIITRIILHIGRNITFRVMTTNLTTATICVFVYPLFIYSTGVLGLYVAFRITNLQYQNIWVLIVLELFIMLLAKLPRIQLRVTTHP